MLSKHLKQILWNRHITLNELSDISEIPLETIRNIVYSKTKNPRLQTVIALCQALDISVEELLSGNVFESDAALLRDFHSCGSYEKRLISLFASYEAEISLDRVKKTYDRKIPCFVPVQSSDEKNRYITYEVKQISTICEEASFAICLLDNRFVPYYKQNDLLLFGSRFPHEGEDFLVLYNNSIYFRKLHVLENGYALCALNRHEPTIYLKKIEKCQIIGTCLGVTKYER